VTQCPTDDLGVVENLLQQLGLLWLGMANDGLGIAWSKPCPVALPHHARSAAWLGPVASPSTVVVPCAWSVGHVMHYSNTVATCSHVLQALNVLSGCTSCRPMMARTSDALETCACALGTCEPNCTGRPARLFFMIDARGPQRTTGRVTAQSPPCTEMDPEPQHMQRTRALPAGPEPRYT
jgi:hypothetical protein